MSEQALPIHTKESGASEEGGPSKNALKKAQKEAEKAAKKAAQKQKEDAQKAAQQASDVDNAKDNYGKQPAEPTPAIELRSLTEASADQEVTVIARIFNSRSQSAKLGFLTLREDGKTIQAVVAAQGDDVSKQMVKWCISLSTNSFVRVTALVKKTPAPTVATISSLELHIKKIYLISAAQQMLPIQPKDVERAPPEEETEAETDDSGAPIVTLSKRLDYRVIDLQSECNLAILRISDGVEKFYEQYMRENGFISVHTSKLVGTATEGGSGVFEVSNYFGRKAYLTQSPQFYKQMLIAGDAKRIFEIGPVFRAENSNTHRHLTEFTGLDFEMVFDTHYHEVLSFAENLIVSMVTNLLASYQPELEVIRRYFPKAGDFRIKDGKALRLKYMDGVALLKDAGADVKEQETFVTDLTTAQEKKLGTIIREKYDTDFYVLDEFPMVVRPFYTKQHPTDPNLSNSYDFFMRGEEIMSGAQRINDAAELEESMRSKGVDPTIEGFQDYIDAFRQGCRPHAGGGLGLNRIVQFFLGLPNVRMATAFPRDPQRLRP